MSRNQVALSFLVFFLAAINILVFLSVNLFEKPELRVAFLDVGQGDAILITSPTGAQMLIDGGKDRSVLRELSKQMNPLDRTIEVVVETHPDADHIGGLPYVLQHYHVGAYISPGVKNDTNQTLALVDAVKKEPGMKAVYARRGMQIDLGGEAYADVLFPDRDISGIETNTGSVVMRLVYGNTEFMLTGDSPETIENYLVSLDGNTLQSDVLKAGHHGSRTSSGEAFLEAVNPSVVVISAGKKNSYGHPHEEVVERVEKKGAKIFSTLGEGAVVVSSDGTKLRVQ